MKLKTALFMLGILLTSTLYANEEGVKSTERLSGTIKSVDKENIDFNDTLIEGKMKVPQGFFIQGRQGQSMANMVKLRSNFRGKLKQSKFAVKALVK